MFTESNEGSVPIVWDTIFPYLLSGVSVGGQYALIAIGYTMVYGILRLINFAHGDVFMVAGIIMVYLAASGLPLWLCIPLVLLITVAVGFLIERAAYKPLRSAPRMSVMISAIGVSYTLQNLVLYITGGLNQIYPTIPWISDSVTVFGATTGIVLKQTVIWGMRRSAFSNEAGLGSAAIAHAAAETKGPVNQGLYGIFEVFIDTIVICTLTALSVIISGVDIAWGVKPGSELITSAFATVFGMKFASLFVAIALMMFAFSTILGWSLYGTRCVQYLGGLKAAKVYRLIFVIVVVIGSVASIDAVWDVADTLNGLMAIPNFVALFALAGVVAKLTKEHFSSDRLKDK